MIRVYRIVVRNGSQCGQMRIIIAPRSSVNVDGPSGPAAKSQRHIAQRARSSTVDDACLRQRELLMSATHADNGSPDIVDAIERSTPSSAVSVSFRHSRAA